MEIIHSYLTGPANFCLPDSILISGFREWNANMFSTKWQFFNGVSWVVWTISPRWTNRVDVLTGSVLLPSLLRQEGIYFIYRCLVVCKCLHGFLTMLTQDMWLTIFWNLVFSAQSTPVLKPSLHLFSPFDQGGFFSLIFLGETAVFTCQFLNHFHNACVFSLKSCESLSSWRQL